MRLGAGDDTWRSNQTGAGRRVYCLPGRLHRDEDGLYSADTLTSIEHRHHLQLDQRRGHVCWETNVVPVPDNQTLPVGTLGVIIEQSDLTVEEFVLLLRGKKP